MKAAVCYEFGKPLVVEEVDLAPPRGSQVKVRIGAVAICHSDVHYIRGDWGREVPVVAGHEAAGIVEEVGADVWRVKPGDRVVVSLLWSCDHCHACMNDAPYLCEKVFPHVENSPITNKAGVRIEVGIRTAAFAEYAIVDETQLVVIPENVPFDSASLLACGVITGLGAAVNTAKVQFGKSAAVIGVGGVGLNAIQGAALSGADPVIAVDLVESKLAAAREFGATHTVHAAEGDPVAAVKEFTGGNGADYVFVTVGNARAAEQGYAMAANCGTITLVGIPDWETKMALPIGGMVWSEKRIIGSPMGSTHLHVDVPKLVEMYQGGRLKLDELISGRYTLERINEAIEDMEKGTALRNVIVFDV